ncbi:hypothetical protein C478_17971 [Natrinema thermotolerans DSM 11552]|uniref:hypothetical protein n=1 Tax=Natrinema sp. H-ect1 TaxID=3242700 RepID=UPI0002AF8FCF|nr:hypothetical protein C478_17971 [Natrinema thermotolerans DSM 11552]
MTQETLQTEFEFTLPEGYVDDEGTLHKEGRMRRATAADEIQPLNNPRVQSNSSYLTVVLLARTVTDLGSLETIDEEVIQNLFVSDLEYLQTMYERVNNGGVNAVDTVCPDCGEQFAVEVETGAHLADPSSGNAETGMTPAGANVDTQSRDISTVSDTGDSPTEEDVDTGNQPE